MATLLSRTSEEIGSPDVGSSLCNEQFVPSFANLYRRSLPPGIGTTL